MNGEDFPLSGGVIRFFLQQAPAAALLADHPGDGRENRGGLLTAALTFPQFLLVGKRQSAGSILQHHIQHGNTPAVRATGPD